MAELLSDFRTIQYYIAAADCNPADMDDYYTEGWAVLRQCALDGQHILNCAADVTVPCASGGPEEQAKAELKQCVVLASFFLFVLPVGFPASHSTASCASNMLSLCIWQGPSRRIRAQARRAKDLSPTGGSTTLDRMAGPGPDGRQAALRKPTTT